MIKTLNQSQFIDEMTFSKDSSYNNCFSYEAKVALFDYYEEYENESGENIECDPIAFCCEWLECENLEEVISQYENIKTIEDLEDQSTVLTLPSGGLLFRQF